MRFFLILLSSAMFLFSDIVRLNDTAIKVYDREESVTEIFYKTDAFNDRFEHSIVSINKDKDSILILGLDKSGNTYVAPINGYIKDDSILTSFEFYLDFQLIK